MTPGTSETSRASGFGELAIQIHDVDDIRARHPDWDELSKAEKLQVARRVAPTERQEVSNVQLNGLHEYLVDHFDRSQSVVDREFEEFAVGTDNTTPAATDTGLGSEVYRTSLANSVDQDRDVLVTGFLDSTEANGNTLREFAILANNVSNTSDVVVANRALFDPEIQKTDQKTVTIDVTLGWRSQ